jgi:hypothetical protein
MSADFFHHVRERRCDARALLPPENARRPPKRVRARDRRE